MKREELEHAIRASCGVSGEVEVWVIGSQAILGQFPNASERLRQSAEADIVPMEDPARAEVIEGVLGELSQFHDTHRFYVHGLTIDAAKLPTGWHGRTFPVRNANTNGHTGHCLEAHDLAASKLAAHREKDYEFVRVLLDERMIDPQELVGRLRDLPIDPEEVGRLCTWVEATARELRDA